MDVCLAAIVSSANQLMIYIGVHMAAASLLVCPMRISLRFLDIAHIETCANYLYHLKPYMYTQITLNCGEI